MIKRLLYIAPVYIDMNKPDGVGKKVYNHIDEFSKYFDTTLFHYVDEGIVERNGLVKNVYELNGQHRRFALYEQVKKNVGYNKYDVVYIRYPKSENNFIQMLRALKKSGCKIVIEIPTYPYNGNLREGPRMVVMAIVDYLYSKQIKKYVDRIVTFSDDKQIFGVPTINTINGIVFDNVKPCEYDGDTKRIQLISVATNYECHGFDRVIKGLEEYYSKKTVVDVDFHIVGNGPAVETYEKMLKINKNAAQHVYLDGFRTGEELTELYNSSDIAVNSLALYRLGLKKESTLKTKEYAAKGLPIISSTEVDAFSENGNTNYVMRVKDDDSPIDISEIIKFYHCIYDNKKHSQVVEHIRSDSKMVCDMSITLKDVVDLFLKE